MESINVIECQLDILISTLTRLKHVSTAKLNILSQQDNIENLNLLSSEEEILFMQLLNVLKDFNFYLKKLNLSNISDLFNSDCNLIQKYNDVLTLESELKEINNMNHSLIMECKKINTFYINLLYPNNSIGYELDSKFINKKRKIINAY